MYWYDGFLTLHPDACRVEFRKTSIYCKSSWYLPKEILNLGQQKLNIDREY